MSVGNEDKIFSHEWVVQWRGTRWVLSRRRWKFLLQLQRLIKQINYNQIFISIYKQIQKKVLWGFRIIPQGLNKICRDVGYSPSAMANVTAIRRLKDVKENIMDVKGQRNDCNSFSDIFSYLYSFEIKVKLWLTQGLTYIRMSLFN